jgi:hypothetical protein
MAEQPEPPTAEQPEEQTAEKPEEPIMEVVEREVTHHQHRIHHHLIMAEPGEGEYLDSRDMLSNWNSPNPSKLKNLKISTEMPARILIPGGYWFKFLLMTNQRISQRMSELLIG